MAGTVAPTVPSRRSGRPAVRSGRSRSSGNPQLCAWPWASPVFCQQFLHRRHVQHLIRHDPLELGILDLQLPQPLGLGCIHATVLLPPDIERGGADPVAPTDVVRLGAGLAFLKHADDLLFSETLPLHGSSSFSNSKVEDSSSQWPGYRGEGQCLDCRAPSAWTALVSQVNSGSLCCLFPWLQSFLDLEPPENTVRFSRDRLPH